MKRTNNFNYFNMSYNNYNNFQPSYNRGGGGYQRGNYQSNAGFSRGYSRPYPAQQQQTSKWKGKKNSNAWITEKETERGHIAIGGAWLYCFYRKQLFTCDITPKYSRKDGDSYESIEPHYFTEQGHIRYKVKCKLTNKSTFDVQYSSGVYNPETGKVYFENLDLLINFQRKTATFNPFNGQFKPKRFVKRN